MDAIGAPHLGERTKKQLIGPVRRPGQLRYAPAQQQLARLLRKPQSFVSNYERGQRRIDVLELQQIVEALKGNPRRVYADILKRRGA